jgi:hypothetical protein
MHTGEAATRRFQYLAIISALKLEALGICIRRGLSVLKVAKSHTGLRSNDRAVHIARLTQMARELEEHIEFVDARREDK